MKTLSACLIGVILITSSCGQSSVYKSLKESAAKLNASLPQYSADGMARVDSIIVIPNDTMVYYCTLLKPPGVIEMRLKKDSIEMIMVERMRTNNSFSAFRKGNVTVIYKYIDPSGHKLFSINLTPKKYIR